MQELKANPDRYAMGTVLEASLDKFEGPKATLLVQNGSLQSGDFLVVGTALLLSAPVLVLVGKDEQAKIAFLVLVGYWLISSILSLASFILNVPALITIIP